MTKIAPNQSGTNNYDCAEYEWGLYSGEQIDQLINDGLCFALKGQRKVLIGNPALLKVNVNVGVSSASEYEKELKKIKTLSSLLYRPDSMMDLSIVRNSVPLWEKMLECFDGAVGTVPYYPLFDPSNGLSERNLLIEIERIAKSGISFMTLHPTANNMLFERAKQKRMIPLTSRGGYILIKDQIINQRKDNLISIHFEEILAILKQYNVCLSIGAPFRPGTILEALDEIHIDDIRLQNHYITMAKKAGVNVIMECIGHCPLNKIQEYANIVKGYNVPLMPLGPILSDECIGFDHINNALGSMALSQTGLVGMINSVTREEHTGKVPSVESIIEGLMTAKAVAHIYNASKFEEYKLKTERTGEKRGTNCTCVENGGLFDFCINDNKEKQYCSRCLYECPRKL